jgi:NAD(P) transhydrogenase subunit alpha
MSHASIRRTCLIVLSAWAVAPASAALAQPDDLLPALGTQRGLDFVSMLFVFMLSTFIGIGVIRRVSRLLHTPLMSLTNAISAIAVVGSIIVAGGEGYPFWIRFLGAVALFCSMTNIVSGFLITDRMLKMFKVRPVPAPGAPPPAPSVPTGAPAEGPKA